MKHDGLLRDVLVAPERLEQLLDAYERPDAPLGELPRAERVLFVGMGSSLFAALPAVALLRSRGVAASVELASTGAPTVPSRDTLVVAVSASGATPETVTALERHLGTSLTAAVTNHPSGPLAASADLVLPLHAGHEEGGVACLTFQATLAVLQLLAGRFTGGAITPRDLRPAVAAAAALRAGREAWLPALADRVAAAHTTYLIAPDERLSSALQSALMLREGPRLPADATETGDWLHVDVYLSKRPGYTALLFPGSRFDDGVMAYARERGSAIVAVGRPVGGAVLEIPVPGAGDHLTALLTETGVAELLAAELWRRGVEGGDPALV